MDILIKGLEMPKSCEECSFNQFHEANPWTTWETCMMLDKDTDSIGEGRLADCPLVALPSHGRLCDLDALIEHETYNIKQALFDSDEVLEDLKNAPVIVEATE